MCGIAGYFSVKSFGSWQNTVPSQMAKAIRHRGPDAEGFFSANEDKITLIHRRLSILDLTEAGAQPMTSHNGRYVIAYNGEIFNAPELKEGFCAKDKIFRGHSDTEIILEIISDHGIYDAVSRFNGMFAFALWDKLEKKLYLVRDRFGVKPLYYAWGSDGSLIFASEIKALKNFPFFNSSLNESAISIYFRHNYIPAPMSIYKDCFKLMPASVMEINPSSLAEKSPKITNYWNPVDKFQDAASARVSGFSEADVLASLDELLFDASKSRMIADVPLGSFLSGGIDSSLVTAMMCRAGGSKVKTFSIGFKEDAFNEAVYASKIASHLGTEHTELYVSSKDALDTIPELSTIWDEPFADSSQIPTYLLAKLTKKYVTVALSGDGGDEIFHGYSRYSAGADLLARRNKMPYALRKFTAEWFKFLPPSLMYCTDDILQPVLKILAKPKYPCRMLSRAFELAATYTEEEFYGVLLSHHVPCGGLAKDGDSISPLFRNNIINNAAPVEKFALLDILSYLPDDILVKVDRASMAVALETRNPLLDYRIAELAFRMPEHLKKNKFILKKLLYKYVPETLFGRPKTGFGIPLGQWLAGPLRDWCESIMSESNLNESGLLNVKNCRRVWLEHLGGKYNHQYSLWNILMFQSWLMKSSNGKDLA